MPANRIAAIFVVVLTLSGCESTGPLYAWGNYEKSVGRVVSPDSAYNIAEEVANLQSDLNDAAVNGSPVPPGFRIHLGYLLLRQGRGKEAIKLFKQERSTYPESATFVDQITSRLHQLAISSRETE